MASFKVEMEPMDLADIVVRSILSCPKEMQSKLASNIVLSGGVCLTPHLIT
jgi:actin-related protein